MDKKLPVDQNLFIGKVLDPSNMTNKLGLVDRVDMEIEKPKSITEYQDVIKNQQGAIKRMKKDDKDQTYKTDENVIKNEYLDHLKHASENKLDKLDMNKFESSDNNKNDIKGNLDENKNTALNKKEHKINKKKIIIKEVNDENLEIDKINLSQNNQNNSQDVVDN
jgi:hypothetical protein